MRQIVLSTVAVALIAASTSQALAAEALAAQSRPHVRKDTAVSDQARKARDAVNQPSQPAWQYSGVVRARGTLTLTESTGAGFVPTAFEKDFVMAVCGLKPQICPQHRI
ncbi:hypothetical protein [Bradyrhizobium japonicum]|uniref:hypothetical protein n=1 Tax=Bradyrhizobium japonicum TaxID=375 RepID=UPI0027153CB1|nr:hypothetical protein [Bradyrhizobium japonicum]WLB58296.1 hypothetical protein QIH94_20660 [Bradyrhizobium japonicum]WLB59905.1 hypothetical protein QIH96_25675 [Bradyrhizobium japonicum]